MPRFLRGLLALVAGLTVVALLSEGRALAYPMWQLSTGASRCNQCHYAPGGGGLLTSYGRDAVGEDLSTFGGDGAFLHGAVQLPSWLAIGGDLRGAFVDHDVQDPDGPTVAVFPMQADLSARFALPAGFSLTGTIGFRGQVRDPDLVVPADNFQPVSTSRLISREHYASWQPEAIGPYVRVGRFFAPYGLRFAEHNLYLRRDLGFDQLQETYNVSGGIVHESWELHLTLFAPDFVRHLGSPENGAAAYLERRFADDTALLAVQTRLGVGPGLARLMGGLVGKVWVNAMKTQLFAEVDGVHLMFDDPAVDNRAQIVATAGFTVLPIPGVNATLLGERNQLDVNAPTAWTGVNLILGWFPYAHCEVQAVGRLQYPSGGDLAKTLFIQLHYFL